jgi:hypothetical protein
VLGLLDRRHALAPSACARALLALALCLPSPRQRGGREEDLMYLLMVVTDDARWSPPGPAFIGDSKEARGEGRPPCDDEDPIRPTIFQERRGVPRCATWFTYSSLTSCLS